MNITNHIFETNYYKIQPLIQSHAVAENVNFASCLDVGSNIRHQASWFGKFSRSIEPKQYIAADIDEPILKQLKELGIDAVNPLTSDRNLNSDLVMALEVVEHLEEKNNHDFFSFLQKNTKKMLACTTPNFEYWENLKPLEDYKELRWVPDHFKDFKPSSADPHTHKQAFTPESLLLTLEKYFNSEEWKISVYRAWPWEIKDCSRDRSYKVFFKIFAIVELRATK
jgi:hypothetical protein